MHAIAHESRERIETGDGMDTSEVAARLIATRRRVVADSAASLHAEAGRVAEEIEVLRATARLKLWETIVQTREIHARICDASARLEHLQLDIREQTGEVRLPAIPAPFVTFLLDEMRRFAITVAAPDGEHKSSAG